MYFNLGKVFISHTAVDKPFVRRLAKSLEKSRFQVWLDERDLIAGDALSESIGKALEEAKAILVVVSKASVKSNWLKYELNVATARMIKGECRVIPVVIDDTPLPAEVTGILYADCRNGLAKGLPSILTALHYEARRADMNQSFSSRINRLVDEVFGSRNSVWTTGYRSKDWDTVTMPIPDADGDEQEAFYDAVQDYMRGYKGESKPLDEGWFDEFKRAAAETQSDFALLVSQIHVEFTVDERSSAFPNVAFRRLSWDKLGMTYLQVVVVDLSKTDQEDQQKASLREAKTMLIECGKYKNAETAKLRAELEKTTT